MADTRKRNRPKNRRRLTVLGGILLVVVIVVGVAVLSPLFKADSVEVEGTVRLDPEQVTEAASGIEGRNLLFADTGDTAAAVSQLPWVEKVTVSRQWPSTVKVSVTEYDAVGVTDSGDGPAVFNERGRIFLRGESPEGAVHVTASEDDGPALAAAGEAVSALPEELRGTLEEVDAPSSEELTLKFPEGREVFWGSADRADEKAEATRVVLSREGQQWNVSNPALPSVRE